MLSSPSVAEMAFVARVALSQIVPSENLSTSMPDLLVAAQS